MKKLSKIALAGVAATVAAVGMWALPSRFDGSIGKQLTGAEIEEIVGGCSGYQHITGCVGCTLLCFGSACSTTTSGGIASSKNPNTDILTAGCSTVNSSCATIYKKTQACGG